MPGLPSPSAAQTPLPRGEALAGRIASCIFLPKFMVYLFCGLARPLTPDQQDGVGGKNPVAVAEELVFSNSMPTSWKNGALPRMSSRKKIADYFGITVEELMGTKKEPAGMGELDKQMQEIVELLFVVSIILCYNSYKLKSRGKRNIE